jgi:ubiquinone/menaquinone biosynthesis C-methylase UbiE
MAAITFREVRAMQARLVPHALLAVVCFAISVLAQAQQSAGSGINTQYKDPNINVAEWVERLEGEGREAYQFRHQIADTIGLEPGQAVADVGAGTGLFEPLLAAKVGKEGVVYAVDIVPKFIEHIAEKAKEYGLTQVRAVLSDDTSTRLPPASVDVLFVCDAYHHFEDYQAMLTSIHQALRPGGKLVIVDFDRVEGKSPPFILEHVRASKEQFTAEIEAAGFRLDKDVDIEGMENTFVRHFDRI